MKKLILAAAAFAMFSSSTALAAGKTYPIVGQVVELTATKITVKTASKKLWEVARDTNTKVPAEVKVGSIVVVQTAVTAMEVVDKTPKAAAKPAAAAAPAADAKKQ